MPRKGIVDMELSPNLRLDVYEDRVRVDFWYPKQAIEDETYIPLEIGLDDVRAADAIRVEYDYERDGYVIKQDFGSDERQDWERESDWRETAFVKAWPKDEIGEVD